MAVSYLASFGGFLPILWFSLLYQCIGKTHNNPYQAHISVVALTDTLSGMHALFMQASESDCNSRHLLTPLNYGSNYKYCYTYVSSINSTHRHTLSIEQYCTHSRTIHAVFMHTWCLFPTQTPPQAGLLQVKRDTRSHLSAHQVSTTQRVCTD